MHFGAILDLMPRCEFLGFLVSLCVTFHISVDFHESCLPWNEICWDVFKAPFWSRAQVLVGLQCSKRKWRGGARASITHFSFTSSPRRVPQGTTLLFNWKVQKIRAKNLMRENGCSSSLGFWLMHRCASLLYWFECIYFLSCPLWCKLTKEQLICISV